MHMQYVALLYLLTLISREVFLNFKSFKKIKIAKEKIQKFIYQKIFIIKMDLSIILEIVIVAILKKCQKKVTMK